MEIIMMPFLEGLRAKNEMMTMVEEVSMQKTRPAVKVVGFDYNEFSKNFIVCLAMIVIRMHSFLPKSNNRFKRGERKLWCNTNWTFYESVGTVNNRSSVLYDKKFRSFEIFLRSSLFYYGLE